MLNLLHIKKGLEAVDVWNKAQSFCGKICGVMWSLSTDIQSYSPLLKKKYFPSSSKRGWQLAWHFSSSFICTSLCTISGITRVSTEFGSFTRRKWYWTYIWGSPNYQSSKAYNFLTGHKIIHSSFNWVWNTCSQLKHKIFFWLLLIDRLNTRHVAASENGPSRIFMRPLYRKIHSRPLFICLLSPHLLNNVGWWLVYICLKQAIPF